MVAGRRTHHAFGELRGAELHHFVVGATQLKAEHRLLVFAFKQHMVVQALAEDGRGVQCRLVGHVVHARCQDFFQIVGRRQAAHTCRLGDGGELMGAGFG